MCVNYRPPTPEQFQHGRLGAFSELPRDWHWPEETWKDYAAPILRAAPGERPHYALASYGMVPRRHIPPDARPFDTMNARAESLIERRSFAPAWRRLHLCAVPMRWFYEPCYESGRAERTAIGMVDDTPFWVAGLWREWEEADGATSTAFTQLTINADDHPLMREGIAAVISSQPDMRVAGEAADGLEAVALYRKLRPHVTLIDLQMPHLNGMDAIAAIRAEFPQACLAILTTFRGDARAMQAIKSGAQGYLLKSSLRKELTDAIRMLAAGHRYIPSEIAGELARQALGKGAPVLRASVQKIGTPVLVAMAIVAISWIWLPAVTVQIMAGMAQSATMFDVLRMVNAGASLQDFGRGGSAGIYGLLCILAMAAPALPALWKHRLAPLGYFAPLAFLAAVGLGIYMKMNAMANAATEQMGSLAGSGMGDIVGAMMKQVMQAVSVGFGIYVSLAAALYLAWIGLRALRQR